MGETTEREEDRKFKFKAENGALKPKTERNRVERSRGGAHKTISQHSYHISMRVRGRPAYPIALSQRRRAPCAFPISRLLNEVTRPRRRDRARAVREYEFI